MINLMGGTTWCEPITRENLSNITGWSMYGNKYRVGDVLGYILVQNTDSQTGEEKISVKLILDREVPRFLTEYKLVDSQDDRYEKIV